jgi:hypothetical protein
MKKAWLFTLSILMAFVITFYTKKEGPQTLAKTAAKWKTYIKTAKSEVSGYHTTEDEYTAARIPIDNATPSTGRSPASIPERKGYLLRNNRVLMGDIDQKYENSNEELEMSNKINPFWKDEMGSDLMRFQDSETKLLVKEELPIIKIQDGKGRYLEQVIITYLMKNGDQSSFKALVDSDTGMVVETWDRTIHEKLQRKRGGFTLPLNTDSGIVTR